MGRSPLARIPPELRNEIYYHAFDGNESINVGPHIEPAITRTCRQLRSETLLLFYKRAIFLGRPIDSDIVYEWLSNLDKLKAAAITNLRIKVPHAEDDENNHRPCRTVPHHRKSVPDIVESCHRAGVSPLAVEIMLDEEAINRKLQDRLNCISVDISNMTAMHTRTGRAIAMCFTQYREHVETLNLRRVYGKEFKDEERGKKLVELAEARKEFRNR